MANHPNRNKFRPSNGANPSPEQIKVARVAAGLTQTEAGAVVYYGCRGWQKFEAEAGTPANSRMHPAIKELWDFKVFGILPKNMKPEIIKKVLAQCERKA